jgi:hypothetical protein
MSIDMIVTAVEHFPLLYVRVHKGDTTGKKPYGGPYIEDECYETISCYWYQRLGVDIRALLDKGAKPNVK